jgi:hypothetical protein
MRAKLPEPSPGEPISTVCRPNDNTPEEGGMTRLTKGLGIYRRLLLAVVLSMLLAACSSDEGADTFGDVSRGMSASDTTQASSTGGGEEMGDTGDGATPDAEEPGADSDDSGDFGDGGIEPVAFQASDLGRDIIFNASITVAVNDVGAAGEEATREIQGLGGFLFGQRTTGAPEPRSILTFKIQPDSFQEALDRLGSIGELRDQDVTADDVTERIVDLESRIATATASVERLRSLLAEASDIEAIVELESELLARETELESLRGSLRTLQDQVALATIVLTLTEAATRPAIDVDLTAYPTHDDGLSCPGDPELVVDQGTEATLCIEVRNTGDTSLTDFEVRDPVLDIELDDMIVVFGDPDTPIEPGESILLAAELLPERDLRTRTTVTAVPVDEDGGEIPGRPASSTVTMFIGAADPGGIPSFTEGLEASWDLLVDFGQLLVLVAGALIPFVWIPFVAWFGWRAWRRRPRDLVADVQTQNE